MEKKVRDEEASRKRLGNTDYTADDINTLIGNVMSHKKPEDEPVDRTISPVLSPSKVKQDLSVATFVGEIMVAPKFKPETLTQEL
jgi:hypothetical protein